MTETTQWSVTTGALAGDGALHIKPVMCSCAKTNMDCNQQLALFIRSDTGTEKVVAASLASWQPASPNS